MASTSPLPSAILVHEYVTGGGWPAPDIPPGLAEEALAMVGALLADLRAWGRFPVVATRDRRLRATGLVADRVVDLGPEVYPTALLELARDCGAALVVAPEGGGALERLSRLLSDAGVCLLGSLPSAVAVAADKWECHLRFARAGLPTPETACVAPAAAAVAAARLGYPVVVKPLDGAGCDGVGLATNDALARGGSSAAGAARFVRGPRAAVRGRHRGQRVVAGRRWSLDRPQPERTAGARGHPVRLRWRSRVAVSSTACGGMRACAEGRRPRAGPARVCGGGSGARRPGLLADRDQPTADHVVRGTASRRSTSTWPRRSGTRAGTAPARRGGAAAPRGVRSEVDR